MKMSARVNSRKASDKLQRDLANIVFTISSSRCEKSATDTKDDAEVLAMGEELQNLAM